MNHNPLPPIFRTIGVGAIFYGIANIAGAGASAVVDLVLARDLPLSEFGTYQLLRSIIEIVAVLAAFGFSTSSVRYLGDYYPRDANRASGFVRFSTGFVAVWGLCLGVASLFIGQGMFGLSPVVALLVGCGVPFLALDTVFSAQLRGMGRISLGEWAIKVGGPTMLLAGYVFIFRGKSGSSADAVFSFVTATSVLVLFLGNLVVGQLRKLNAFDVSIPVFAVPDGQTRMTWLKVSWAMLLMAGFAQVIFRSDLILVGIFAPAGEVGLYAAAGRVTKLADLGLSAVAAALAPTIARLSSPLTNTVEINRLLRVAWIALFSTSGLIGFAILVFPDLILQLFGQEFVEGQVLLRLLIIGHLFHVLSGPVFMVLNMVGEEQASARLFFGATVLNLVLSMAFGKLLGSVGIAIASAVTIALLNLSGVYWLLRRKGIHSSVSSLLA